MMTKCLFEPPRWRGGPPICLEANLPAFATWDEARKFILSLNGKGDVVRWRCEFCNCFHYTRPSKKKS